MHLKPQKTAPEVRFGRLKKTRKPTLEDAIEHVLIRAARMDDFPLLGTFGAQLMALHHDWDQDRFISARPGTETAYGDWLAKQAEIENVFVIVAELDTAVIGYAYARLEGYDYMALRGPAGVLHDLFVDPVRRRKGVGTQLLEGMTSRLVACGAAQVVLSTAARNEAAQRVFAKAGFRPTMIEMTMTISPSSMTTEQSPIT